MKHLRIITTIILTILVMGDASSGRQGPNRRNPFAPLDETVRSTSTIKRQRRRFGSIEVSLRLSGIIWTKENPVAIINDTVVIVGSGIFDRKVSAISAEQVELEYRGKKEILRMIPKILFSVNNKKSDTKTVFKKGQ